jgi:hypothetical protein
MMLWGTGCDDYPVQAFLPDGLLDQVLPGLGAQEQVILDHVPLFQKEIAESIDVNDSGDVRAAAT